MGHGRVRVRVASSTNPRKQVASFFERGGKKKVPLRAYILLVPPLFPLSLFLSFLSFLRVSPFRSRISRSSGRDKGGADRPVKRRTGEAVAVTKRGEYRSLSDPPEC